MAEYLIQDTTLDAIADAINAKTGGSSAMTPAEMVTAIEAIPTGGGLTTITLSDSALWERKDVSSNTANGSSYDTCKSDSTNRISTISLYPYLENMQITCNSAYEIICLLFDDNKRYIGWAGNGWLGQKVAFKSNALFTQKNTGLSLSDASYYSITAKRTDNQSMTIAAAATANVTITFPE